MSANLLGVYLTKPLQYPDGKYYLKLGANLPTDHLTREAAELTPWFRVGDSDHNLPALRRLVSDLLPALPVVRWPHPQLSWQTKRCAISRTVHGRPYLGSLGPGLLVAAGGNGYSAMCSDALGQRAARLLAGENQLAFQPCLAQRPRL